MLNPDFKEFIKLLNENDVRYMVVGGYAVALHGHPRYTKDLDILIECSESSAERMMNVLEQFGFGSLGLSISDFLDPEQVIQLGYPPNRIDLLHSLTGVNFSTAYLSKEEVIIDGVPITFIGLESLKDNKRALGRHQDLADLENLS
jgi:predicted nucleotidyltransferase